MATKVQRIQSLLRVLLALGALAAAGCSDGNGPEDADEPELLPDPTPRGTPTGPAVSKTIGSEGGSLTSADGGLTLTVPAGAVTAPTEFGIQPIANTAHNGVGQAHRLTPEGLTFAAPVRLAFRYTDDELESGGPEGLAIAYQDADGRWWGLLATSLDETAKALTVSVARLPQATPSLSSALSASLATSGGTAGGAAGSGDLVKVRSFQISADKDPVKVKQSALLQAQSCFRLESKRPSPVTPGEDELPALPRCSSAGGSGTWYVNGDPRGNATVGQVSASGADAVYTAPAKAPSPKTVNIKAEMTWNLGSRRRPDIRLRTLRRTITVEEDCPVILRRASFDLALATASDDVCEVIPLRVVATFNRRDQPIIGGYYLVAATDGFEADVDLYPTAAAAGAVARIQNSVTTTGNLRPFNDGVCDTQLSDRPEIFTADSGAVGGALHADSAMIHFFGRWKDASGTVVTKNAAGECQDLFTYSGLGGPTGIFFTIPRRAFVKSGDTRTVVDERIAWTFVVTRK